MSAPKILDLGSLKQACKSCSLHDLCLPLGVGDEELQMLERIINRRRPLQRKDHLYRPGDRLHSIYAVRSGTVKTYTLTDDGQEQITGFHLPGELLGLDAISDGVHPCAARALETTSICEIPFDRLEELSVRIPGLQHQLFRIMSREIQTDEQFMMLLGKKASDARLAAFLLSLSTRLGMRGFSRTEFNLTMSRNDIANYLGLAVETVSRLFTRFQNAGLIEVHRKLITIYNLDGLQVVAGAQPVEEPRCCKGQCEGDQPEGN
ncbi:MULTISPECIES: fumarate/nitrate reduction transcriptional regulator Fnr [Ectothiorhodospira]|jgi:CRP/FNR family transcriptional regulator|uniref:CRP/FNR family transcriptional regulator, anaerobic regulatory protein n=1 Tax=Ectothiorhodospira marina TaxID=1396821 RepID=A0A1H7K0B9_9GAMM|nr:MULTISPECIES: fumarate/nitrate reduction transcriptional regulator Fnr [Ectothiorhodospira]MCG5517034.1 fumarate/nitrate reduction transcriptional regulator Fnr [Ectothiorhodospira sp. 9100]MCG5519921.1 fumarate/nitrate reduction transcriptional regulator Fnr [Ectothiorhodospira sp. 9905]SEK79946.1 CRP/FNR family transcriptional regulator, anaerobic regulatory protein [Ectothiorhodospira marina]